MDKAIITYFQSVRKIDQRKKKQHSFAVAQTAKEGRELKEAALVNSR